ncbi:MAG: hypothetical protein J7M21_00465, partial [Planctomycetes bacterium]|nr:hypothetical protein [Planctomycetota bacterium]
PPLGGWKASDNSAGGPAVAEDPLPILRSLAAHEATAPALRYAPADEQIDITRYVLYVTVFLLVVLAGIGVFMAARSAWMRRPLRPVNNADVAAGLPAPAARRPADASRPAGRELLVSLQAALPSVRKVRRLLEQADPVRGNQALEAAADMLIDGPTQRQRAEARVLFQAILQDSPARGDVQDEAVAAIIDRLAKAAEQAGPLDPRQVYRGVSILGSLLFLQEARGMDFTDPAAVGEFLERCRRAWSESLRSSPADPVSDPKRLAEAVLAGGSLADYGRRSDARRFAAVAALLVDAACRRRAAEARRAIDALHAAAADGRLAPDAGRQARLALCGVIERSGDAETARRARDALADVLALPGDSPLRTAATATASDRRRAAEALRRIVEAAPGSPTAGGPEAPRSAASRPAGPSSRKAPRRTGPLLGPIARKLRAGWADASRRGEVLADLAVLMFACADRTARLTAGNDVLTGELQQVLGRDETSLRSAALTRRVALPDPLQAPASPPARLDAEVARRLKIDLRSRRAGTRDRAVEDLRVLGGREAVELLLERLGEIIRSGSSSNYPTMNRILRALEHMDDAEIPRRLAEMIIPARTNYAAHRIVMTLLAGSGRESLQQQWHFLLPINHNSEQRKQCAARWQTVARSCPWGPGRLALAVRGPTGPPPAWQPPRETEKLLAHFVHYLRLTGELLRAWQSQGEAAGAGAADALLRTEPAKITRPASNDELRSAAKLLVAQLDRLARRQAGGKKRLPVQLDVIELADRARSAACSRPLQVAAVHLATAGRILDVMARAKHAGAADARARDELRADHEAAMTAADNVLAELRENAWYVLALLEILA